MNTALRDVCVHGPLHEPETFLRRYRAHVRRKLLVRGAVVPVQRMLGRRDGRSLPRLA